MPIFTTTFSCADGSVTENSAPAPSTGAAEAMNARDLLADYESSRENTKADNE
jgi:hypothetical protein